LGHEDQGEVIELREQPNPLRMPRSDEKWIQSVCPSTGSRGEEEKRLPEKVRGKPQQYIPGCQYSSDESVKDAEGQGGVDVSF
jgi:hypothetical protein